MIIAVILLLAFIAYGVYGWYTARQHEFLVKKNFSHRIHVNGIRGKSSVTRLVAATLREANIKTIGKTTGTAARMFVSHSMDWPITRNEANIAEQRSVLKKYIDSKYKAIVFECMAVNPIYQKYLEEKIMHSTIGIITNVREDHVDKLGHSLTEIAQSLGNTIPYNAHFITAETNPDVIAAFKDICKQRNTKYHQAPVKEVSIKHLGKFKHYEYADNVAIALCVAKIVGIKKRIALKGMYQALPDPGAFQLRKYEFSGKKNKTIYWANLFAINDRESFIHTVKALQLKIGNKTKRAVILNNRHDRPERVAQFVDIALNSLKVDYIITFGDYEKQVQRLVNKSLAKKKPRVIHLGNSSDYKSASGEVLWQKIIEQINNKECLIVGAVNIHTQQSQSLLQVVTDGQYA